LIEAGRARTRGRIIKAAPKRRPSAAKRIIRVEVPKDTGPIYLQASFFRTAAARHGLYDLDLFAGTGVLDKMPDADDAIEAGAGAQALEAGVVRLYRVVVILGG
jgi:hypothetical protein